MATSEPGGVPMTRTWALVYGVRPMYALWMVKVRVGEREAMLEGGRVEGKPVVGSSGG